MSVTLILPPIVESALTGWHFTLKMTYRGVEWSAKYMHDGTAHASRNGVAVPNDRVPASVCARLNETSAALTAPAHTEA